MDAFAMRSRKVVRHRGVGITEFLHKRFDEEFAGRSSFRRGLLVQPGEE